MIPVIVCHLRAGHVYFRSVNSLPHLLTSQFTSQFTQVDSFPLFLKILDNTLQFHISLFLMKYDNKFLKYEYTSHSYSLFDYQTVQVSFKNFILLAGMFCPTEAFLGEFSERLYFISFANDILVYCIFLVSDSFYTNTG